MAVQGLGLIGQLALRLYLRVGAWPVVGIDPVPLRRKLALAGGAAAALDPAAGPVEAQLREALGGRLPEVCVDATGVAEAVPAAARLVERGGQVVVLGSPRGVAKEVDMYELVHGRSLTLSGAHGSILDARHPLHPDWSHPRALALLARFLASKSLPVGDLVTHDVAPEGLHEAYRLLLERKEESLTARVRWSA
ncbi:MAG: zinc-binding dehydrogenase [Planctomycetota bacterium]|nr:zinc-binding dehydrogenase [Planctomycetota bacterium]